jgi:hypothetical protein
MSDVLTADEVQANGNGGTSSAGYLTVDQAIENAAADRVEADVTDVFGGRVRIRSLSAAQQARVKQASMNLGGRNPTIAWAEMERLQFELGVIEPKFTAEQVKKLHIESGPSFARVIEEIDRVSGLNKEELRQAQEDFPGSGE